MGKGWTGVCLYCPFAKAVERFLVSGMMRIPNMAHLNKTYLSQGVCHRLILSKDDLGEELSIRGRYIRNMKKERALAKVLVAPPSISQNHCPGSRSKLTRDNDVKFNLTSR